ncbi:hypothetical protein CYMTET_31788 [Cymbomonas tetramitiformis]|uniref:Uncharacterized protein n=1 Tax=Cymbomonas tetramitiformis TaxID=36881 RepID=A0AAE0KSW2_9CHLO|nr:hypothetical protein CYMTET_31788 [Cymbomonas tetramitiformis]
MKDTSAAVSRGAILLTELGRLFDSDPLIDEVGLLPTTEHLQVETAVDKQNTLHPEAFFLAEHKLALALPALQPLHAAANELLLAHLPSPLQRATTSPEHSNSARALATADVDESALLNAARTLVLINGEHACAWNVRKRWLLRLAQAGAGSTTSAAVTLPYDEAVNELRLVEVVHSVRPKAIAAWAHRRWVLQNAQLLSLAPGEAWSERHAASFQVEARVCARAAQLRRLNYSAWRHLRWAARQLPFTMAATES